MTYGLAQTGVVIAACMIAPAVSADDLQTMSAPAAAEPTVDALINGLNSDELAERERCERQLHVDGRVSLDQIERLLTSGDLPAESLERLGRVGLSRFRLLERAALGVSWQQDASRVDGLEIAAPAKARFGGEEFDSTKMLMPRDVIVALDGERVALFDSAAQNWENCRALILSYDPGDEIELRVLRDEQPMTLRLRMGRLNDLDRPAMADPTAILPKAWTYRLERRSKELRKDSKAEAGAGPLDSGLSRADWDRLIVGVEGAEEEAANKPKQNASAGRPGARAAGNDGVVNGDALQFFHAGVPDQDAKERESLATTLNMRLDLLRNAKMQAESLPEGRMRDAKLREMQVLSQQVAELRKKISARRALPATRTLVP
ncbi:MAG: hypothetical protein ACOYN0_02235 [Phycisphaerales bacterium]